MKLKQLKHDDNDQSTNSIRTKHSDDYNSYIQM